MLQWQWVFFGPLVWSPTAPKAFSPFPYVACANAQNQTSAQRDRNCCWTVFFSSGHLPSSQPSDETAGTLRARLWTMMSSPSGSHSQCNPSSSWAEEAEKTNNGACEKKTTVCAGWCFPMSSPCVSSMVWEPSLWFPKSHAHPSPTPKSRRSHLLGFCLIFHRHFHHCRPHTENSLPRGCPKRKQEDSRNSKRSCSLSLWFWVLHDLAEKTYRSSLVPIKRMEVQPRGRTLS